ncbi:hypothetical protein [Porcipelethomonas sp.]|uniref:hypothetical protein n=1 Tax=Porcipelethomonas sp. TaxID=2981675 RepID=UPI003EFAE4C0
MNKRKLISAAMAALIAVCPLLNVSAEVQNIDRPDLNYSDMKYQKFDDSKLTAASDELKSIAEKNTKGKEARVEELINIMLEEYDLQATMYSIRYNDFYFDVTNEQIQDELLELEENYQDYNDIIFSALNKIYNSDYQDIIFDMFNEDYIPAIAYYEESDEEYIKLSKEELELTMEYEKLSAQDYSVEYKGKTWNADELYNNPPESQDEYDRINSMIFTQKNKELGEIYCELLKARDKIAKLYGYTDYAKYAYENLYIRDYSLDDADKMYEEVKTSFSDIYNDLYNSLSFSIYSSGLSQAQYSGEEVMDAIEPYFSEIDPDFAENFQYLRDHDLYNIDPMPNKMFGGYTVSLYSYSVPFIFNCPIGDYNDIRTMIHEFGHANAEFIHPTRAFDESFGNSLDTLEIHSQGMEVLFTDYSDDIFGQKSGKVFKDYTIYAMTSSIIEGCLFDEFQRFAYENPDSTVDQLNAKYEELCGEYGVEYSRDVVYFMDWTDVAHNYNAPMYYISYATSALSSLDLWIKNADDRDSAIDTYKNLIDCQADSPYMETIKKIGLRNIFEPGTITSIAEETSYLLENGTNAAKETDVQTSVSADNSTISTETSVIQAENTLKTKDYNVKNIFYIVFSVVFSIIGIFVLGIAAMIIILIVMIKKRKDKNNINQ